MIDSHADLEEVRLRVPTQPGAPVDRHGCRHWARTARVWPCRGARRRVIRWGASVANGRDQVKLKDL